MADPSKITVDAVSTPDGSTNEVVFVSHTIAPRRRITQPPTTPIRIPSTPRANGTLPTDRISPHTDTPPVARILTFSSDDEDFDMPPTTGRRPPTTGPKPILGPARPPSLAKYYAAIMGPPKPWPVALDGPQAGRLLTGKAAPTSWPGDNANASGIHPVGHGAPRKSRRLPGSYADYVPGGSPQKPGRVGADNDFLSRPPQVRRTANTSGGSASAGPSSLHNASAGNPIAGSEDAIIASAPSTTQRILTQFKQRFPFPHNPARTKSHTSARNQATPPQRKNQFLAVARPTPTRSLRRANNLRQPKTKKFGQNKARLFELEQEDQVEAVAVIPEVGVSTGGGVLPPTLTMARIDGVNIESEREMMEPGAGDYCESDSDDGKYDLLDNPADADFAPPADLGSPPVRRTMGTRSQVAIWRTPPLVDHAMDKDTLPESWGESDGSASTDDN